MLSGSPSGREGLSYADHRRRMAAYINCKAIVYASSRLAHTNGQYAGFTDLPPELRNRIYEYIAPPRNQHVTICAEKDVRDVPYALSRTCRLVRQETAPYFLSGEGATLILILETAADATACREWISFIPEYSLSQVRTIKIKAAPVCRERCLKCEASSANRTVGCEAIFGFDLDTERPGKCHAFLRKGCEERESFRGETRMVRDFVEALPVEIKGERVGGRKMTRECLEVILGILEGN